MVMSVLFLFPKGLEQLEIAVKLFYAFLPHITSRICGRLSDGMKSTTIAAILNVIREKMLW